MLRSRHVGGLGIGVNDRIWQSFQDVWGPLRGQHVVLCQDQEFRSVLSVFISKPACSSTSAPPPTSHCLAKQQRISHSKSQPSFTMPDRQPHPHPTPPRPTHSFSGLHSGDHQHSRTTIFSQGPHISDLHQLRRDLCLLESFRRGRGGPAKLCSHIVCIVVHRCVYMIMYLGQNQTVSGSMSQL